MGNPNAFFLKWISNTRLFFFCIFIQKWYQALGKETFVPVVLCLVVHTVEVSDLLLQNKISIAQNWPKTVWDFSVKFIKILSPGLERERESCSPKKAPADLLPLAHFPVRLKPPKLQSKLIRPKSPDGDGFCCWTCSRNPKLEAFKNPECLFLSQGLLPLLNSSASCFASLLI